MTVQNKYEVVYDAANLFLEELINDGHLDRGEVRGQRKSKGLKGTETNDIREVTKLLFSQITNTGYMKGPIGFSKNEAILREVLCGFDAKLIIEKFHDAKSLFIELKKKCEIKKSEKSWKKFSKGIISGSEFMRKFNTKGEFEKFAEVFLYNEYTKEALPLFLKSKIKGFGLALASSFLKDYGFRNFGKPDIHLTEIFTSLNLSDSDQANVSNAIGEMAKIVGVDEFEVDKIFWLISGRKYGNSRKEFIKFAKKKIKNLPSS